MRLRVCTCVLVFHVVFLHVLCYVGFRTKHETRLTTTAHEFEYSFLVYLWSFILYFTESFFIYLYPFHTSKRKLPLTLSCTSQPLIYERILYGFMPSSLVDIVGGLLVHGTRRQQCRRREGAWCRHVPVSRNTVNLILAGTLRCRLVRPPPATHRVSDMPSAY